MLRAITKIFLGGCRTFVFANKTGCGSQAPTARNQIFVEPPKNAKIKENLLNRNRKFDNLVAELLSG